MTKVKNQRIYSRDPEFLKNLADEQENYIGRPFKLDLKRGVLIIYALPRKAKGKDKKEKTERNKRSEKFEKRS